MTEKLSHECGGTMKATMKTTVFAIALLWLGLAQAQWNGGQRRPGPGNGGHDREQWIYCANENQTCRFQGVAEVRYGAEGKFFYQTARDGINCNNNTFGDPIRGRVKQCSYRMTNGGGWNPAPPPPYGQPTWIKCADENQVCRIGVRGETVVRYGAAGSFYERTARGYIDCNNNTFGDPIRGRVKACYYWGYQ